MAAAKENKELLRKIRDRYSLMVEADDRNRKEAMKDMEFTNVPGAQWDDSMKTERGKRPCYEFNKLRIACKRVINEMRASRPAGKVRGAEDGDKDTAEVYEGLIRNIWNASDGDTVIDTAAEYQVGGGMGAWRVATEYCHGNPFDQDIKIEQINNPFCLYADPSAKDPMKRDAHDWILTEKIPVREYEEKYGKAAEQVSWEESDFDDEAEWSTDEEVRVAEYWWKEPIDKEFWQLKDGKIIDPESPAAEHVSEEEIREKRSMKTHKIMMCIASGSAILEQPTEWAGSYHPFIMIYGEYMVIDGRVYWFGLPRFAKDAQRSYNVSRTAIAESIASAPLATDWVTTTQAAGLVDEWAEAHQKNFPFRRFNPDPLSPGPPKRTGGADVPVALIQESQIASDEIKAVTGIFSADMGAPNNATSGRQEIARQQQGQMATFNFIDNLSKGVSYTWEILIDLIPKIIDTEKTVRILGVDGAEKYVKVNTFEQDPATGESYAVNDLASGRYDVVVTTGPGFATKRQEAVEAYAAITQGSPEVMGFAGDLIMKAMDLPYSEEIGERFKAMLPPPIQQMINEDTKVPPEVQQMMQQADQAMQEVQAMAQEVQKAAAEAEKEKSVNDKGKAEIQTMIANLKTQEAQFEAKVQQAKADLAERNADVTVAEQQYQGDGDMAAMNQAHEQLMVDAAQAVDQISQMSEQFTRYAVDVLDQVSEKADKQKVVRIDSYREDGKLVAVPVYEDPDLEAPGQAGEAQYESNINE